MHHLLPAEFVPALPALGGAAELALSLFTLVLWGVALGMAIAWRYTLGAALEWAANVMDKVSIPLGFTHIRPLHPFAAQLRSIDYAITAGLAKILHGAEHATVWLFRHGLNLIVWTAREIWALSRDTLRAFEHFNGVVLPRWERHARAYVRAYAGALVREANRLDRRLNDAIRSFVHREAAAWRSGVHVLRQSIAHALPRIGHVERDLSGVKSRLRSLEHKLTVPAFAALLIAALSRLGLKWLRCGNVNRVGRSVCGMNPALLESLLADALLVGGALSLVELAEHMQGVVGESAGLIQRFWDAA